MQSNFYAGSKKVGPAQNILEPVKAGQGIGLLDGTGQQFQQQFSSLFKC